jgi:hypothetical protein
MAEAEGFEPAASACYLPRSSAFMSLTWDSCIPAVNAPAHPGPAVSVVSLPAEDGMVACTS